MADEVTTNDQDETPDDTADSGASSLGDAGQKALAAERDARKTAERELRDARKSLGELNSRVKAFEDRGKSDTEKAAERIAELERTITEKDVTIAARERDTERAKVAAAKGVPLNLVTGSTIEEMEAAADAALEWRSDKGKVTSPLRPRGLLSGASAPPDGATQKQTAAAALRAMRAGQ